MHLPRFIANLLFIPILLVACNTLAPEPATNVPEGEPEAVAGALAPVVTTQADLLPLLEGHCDGTATFNITCDPNTGLEWLDLTVTKGNAYKDVRAKLSTGGQFEEYRYATRSEFNQLIANAGIAFFSGDRSSDHEATRKLLGLLGVTYSFGSGTATYGYLGETS